MSQKASVMLSFIRTRRRLVVVVALTLIVLIAVGARLIIPPKSARINRENSSRIQIGMTLTEVEEILGPPGDYRTCDNELDRWASTTADDAKLGNGHGTEVYVWMCNTLQVAVCFDDDGGVAWVIRLPMKPFHGEGFEQLTWRLKRLWRGAFPEK
jgi:hypothetical protein